jgi:hypothetical protein
MHVVFFFVGSDISEPTMMVNSLRKIDPTATVVQCCDYVTRAIPGVSEVRRFKIGNSKRLMIDRVAAFSQYSPPEPAVYVDTDMLWLKKINLSDSLGDRDVILCKRSFNVDSLFNTEVKLSSEFGGYKGSDLVYFEEHKSQTLGAVFPYLACFSIARNGDKFWGELLETLESLPEKYQYWYGDQEAMRLVVDKVGAPKFGFAGENVVACLPEYLSTNPGPALIHFKGRRKVQMETFYQALLGDSKFDRSTGSVSA